MTQEQIDKQITVLRKASAEAGKSKESARQFLMEAGIIKKQTAKAIESAPKR